MILTDDRGYGDVDFHGCKDIPTPNIDSIARDGVQFTSGYVTFSVCSPIYLRKFDQGAFAVRRGDYKLVIPKQGAPAELFNLAQDIGESRDIAASEPGVVTELEKLRAAWASQLVPPVFEDFFDRAKPRKGPR